MFEIAENILCAHIDRLGEIVLGQADHCSNFEEIVGGFMSDLLDPTGLLSLPSVDEIFGGFDFLDDIFDRFGIDNLGFFTLRTSFRKNSSLSVPLGSHRFLDFSILIHSLIHWKTFLRVLN